MTEEQKAAYFAAREARRQSGRRNGLFLVLGLVMFVVAVLTVGAALSSPPEADPAGITKKLTVLSSNKQEHLWTRDGRTSASVRHTYTVAGSKEEVRATIAGALPSDWQTLEPVRNSDEFADWYSPPFEKPSTQIQVCKTQVAGNTKATTVRITRFYRPSLWDWLRIRGRGLVGESSR